MLWDSLMESCASSWIPLTPDPPSDPNPDIISWVIDSFSTKCYLQRKLKLNSNPM